MVAAVAIVTLPPVAQNQHLASQETASMSGPGLRQPRLAIVGCGQIVTHHLAAMNYSTATTTTSSATPLLPPLFRVVALCDPNPVRRNVVQGLLPADNVVSHYNSLDELLRDSAVLYDVIFIAVPHDLHESLALQALSQTSTTTTVVLEKPLAPTAAACDRLVQASLEYSNRLIVAEQSPYWPEVVLAKELLQPTSPSPSAIGDIVSAAAYYYESMRDNVTSGSVASGGGLGWRGSIARAGGGIAMDGGVHWIRPVREMLGGRIARVVGHVYSHPGTSRALDMEGETVGHALFAIERPRMPAPPDDDEPPLPPLIGTYSCCLLATAPMAHDTCPYFRITGTGGEIVIYGSGLQPDTPGAGGLRLYNAAWPTGREMFDPHRRGGFFLGFAALWREIHRIVGDSDGAAAHETVVRAADDVRVVLALYKSSASQQWEST